MWLTTLNKMQIPDYSQHQLLWGFFPSIQKADGERPFCFRDAGDQIIMLSNAEPATESKKIEFEAGQTLMFECRASVGERSYQGKIYKPQDFTAEHTKQWFRNRFKDIADINYVSFKALAPHVIVDPTNRKGRMPLNQTMFFGTLTVVDPDAFTHQVGKGIGQGCAFGFGALILPQVMK